MKSLHEPFLLPSNGKRRLRLDRALLHNLSVTPPALFLACINDVYAASFGLLLIPLATGVSPSFGVPMYLFSVTTAQLGAVLRSNIPFATGGSTFELLPLLAPMAQLVVADSSLDAAARASNILAMYAATSLLIGCLYLAAAKLRVARLFRCIPLVVLKGALTSVGLFMVLTAGRMAVAHAFEGILSLLDQSTLWRVGTTLALAVGLALVDRAVASPLASVAYLSLAAAAFNLLPHLHLLPAGSLGEDWYFSAHNEGASPFGILAVFDPREVRVELLVRAVPYMLSCALVHSLMAVCDLVSLEAMAAEASGGVEFDLDREIGSIGLGNLLAACCGATPNYVQLSPSVTNYKLAYKEQAASRESVGDPPRAGPWVALFSFASLWAIDSIVQVVPRPVVGAFMLWLGLHFVKESAIDLVQRSSDPVDWVIIVLMTFLMMGVGFVEGLSAGLLIALLHFVVLYSRAPIVRFISDGTMLQSNTVRPHRHRVYLNESGDRLPIVSLQGYLMFGSSLQLTEAIGSIFSARDDSMKGASAPQPWFVIFDMRAVKGCDFGSVQELVKLKLATDRRGGTMRIAQPPAHVMRGIQAAARGTFDRIVDLQDTLRECEDILLSHSQSLVAPVCPGGTDTATDLDAVLIHLKGVDVDGRTAVRTACVPREQPIEQLARYLLRHAEVRPINAGDTVWRPKDNATFYVIVLHGRLRLLCNGQVIEDCVPGSCVGYLFMFASSRGAYALRDTLLVAAEASRLLVLDRHLLAKIQNDNPTLDRMLLDGMIANMSGEYRRLIRLNAVADAVSLGKTGSSASLYELDEMSITA
ncbi:hypothetical protein AB1Y20_009765 [Prymnesium parvum]|uniref:Sulfate transporter n=1 Tax=Prymnesium parvum TaxID=97485 RepID=A0AB34K610_PRYPA